ncbi:MAG: hypothetical protein P8H03_02185, partial [Emcibacteraceae bacterium]|nr:hypothetical protein [Emcibacteraceae bacterium]
DIRAGGTRINYMRAVYTENEDGIKSVSAEFSQSSARLKTMSDANCLLMRPLNAPPAIKGDLVKILMI